MKSLTLFSYSNQPDWYHTYIQAELSYPIGKYLWW